MATVRDPENLPTMTACLSTFGTEVTDIRPLRQASLVQTLLSRINRLRPPIILVIVLRLPPLTIVLAGPPGKGTIRSPAPGATVVLSLLVARWNLPLVPSLTGIGALPVSI